MKKLNYNFNQLLFGEMIYFVILVIFGVVVFFNNRLSSNTTAILIGIFIIIKSILGIMAHYNQKQYFLYQFSVILGVLGFILALFLIINPFKLLNNIGLLLGIWLIGEALNKYMIYSKYKKKKEKCASILGLSAVITAFMAILLIINPFVAFALTNLSGAFLVFYGIITLSDLVLIKNHSQELLKKSK